MQLLPPANQVCEGYVFTPICHSVQRGGACVAGGHAWQGGAMCGRGCAWQGACVVGACVAGGHVWQRGHAWWWGMHGRGACMAGEACMAGGMHATHPWHYEIRSVNARAVCILLECILVLKLLI